MKEELLINFHRKRYFNLKSEMEKVGNSLRPIFKLFYY